MSILRLAVPSPLRRPFDVAQDQHDRCRRDAGNPPDLTERLAREHEVLITIEEGSRGGFGAFVLHHLADVGALDRGLKIRTMHLPDIFQDQDKPDLMYEEAGLNARHIAACAIEALGRGDVAEIERLARA